MIDIDFTDFKSRVIKKGKHYCSKLFRFHPFFDKKKLSYNVIFTDSCVYDIGYPDNLDINKLFGMSYGYHHTNSARFGWNCYQDRVGLFAYCYIDGKRQECFICNLKLNVQYKLTLLKLKDKYSFIVSSKDTLRQVSMQHPVHMPLLGYELWPYFGGNQVAPHEIKILMYENE